MQNMLVKRHVKGDRVVDEKGLAAYYTLCTGNAIADSDWLHGVVGLCWDHLVSLVQEARQCSKLSLSQPEAQATIYFHALRVG